MAAVRGGVFHTRYGIPLAGLHGEPIFGVLRTAGGAPLGLAVGVRQACRIPGPPRHSVFPSLPALAHGVDRAAALGALRTALDRAGLAAAELGSFDAAYTPGAATRLEFLVQLPPDGEIASGLSTQLRRNVRRAEREGATLRLLTGPEATRAVLAVQQSTSERAAALARRFDPVTDTAWQQHLAAALPLPPAGLAVFAAERGAELLAAVLVGWAGRRAFYAVGGSTPAGYDGGAAPWLQVQVARVLADTGMATYNLGGTPREAADPAHPAHGLYRYKTGFGAEVVELGGLEWTLRPGHIRLHTLLSRLQALRR